MDDAEPVQVVAAAVLLLVVVLMAVTQLPKWWRGTSNVSPDRPPDGWLWGRATWRGLARALPVSLVMLGSGCVGLLLEPFSARASGVAVVAAVVAAVLWLCTAVLARPCALVPPPWRPAPRRR